MGMLENIQTGKENKPPRIMIYGSEGVGKAQPLTAKVLTPYGWTTIGSLKPEMKSSVRMERCIM